MYKNLILKQGINDIFYINGHFLDILDNEYKLKTMIICTTINEAEELNAFLLKYRQTLLVHEKKHLFEIQGLKKLTKIIGLLYL